MCRVELDRALTGVALVFEPGAGFERGSGEVHRASLLGRYLKRVLQHDGALVRILLLSILLQLFALAVPLLTGFLIDRVLPHGDHQLYWILAAGAATLVAFSALANFVRAHILLTVRTRLDAQLTTDFLDHLIHLPFSFFQQRSTGDLMMRVNSNATIRETLTSGVLSGALDGLMVVTYLVLLLVADVRLGLVIAGLAVLRVAVLAGAMRVRRRLTTESLQVQAVAQSYELQLLAGIEVLKACGAERRAIGTWSNLFVQQLNVSLARGRLDALVNALLDGLALASPVTVLLYGGMRVMHGELTLGMMLAPGGAGLRISRAAFAAGRQRRAVPADRQLSRSARGRAGRAHRAAGTRPAAAGVVRRTSFAPGRHVPLQPPRSSGSRECVVRRRAWIADRDRRSVGIGQVDAHGARRRSAHAGRGKRRI